MTDIRLVHEYPHSPAKVWRALTDPALMALWMVAARPEGFSAEVGTRFKFVARPMPGWRGIVQGEVLEAREPTLFRYSWVDDREDEKTLCSYRLEPLGAGTRFTFEHTGFKGLGGLVVAKVITSIRKKMFGVRLPAVLADMDSEGSLRAGSRLRQPRI